jgi:dTMP kinase
LTGLFITLEGPEGGGKTTHARLLYEYLREEEYPVVLTREPGGTRISDKVRQVLLDPDNTDILPRTEILLFSASRAQLSEEFIRPHLDQGHIVICDRYADSTLAYQGHGLGLDLDTLRAITAFATGGLTPDLTLYLDVPIETGLKRRLGMGNNTNLAGGGTQLPLFDKWDRLDMKELEYHRRVQQGYEQLMQAEPDRWHKVDANRPLDQVQDDIRRKVLSALEGRS